MREGWKKIHLVGGIEPTDIITSFTERRPDGFVFTGEMHDFWEIVLVRSGSIWAAEEQRVVKLKKNMFIVHSPMAFHRLWCSGGEATISVISFCLKGDGDARLRKLYGTCPPTLADGLWSTVELGGQLLRGVLSECERREISGRVKAMLSYMLHELSALGRTESGEHEASDAERILAIINEHYLEELTLERLAHYCRMSESKIKKEFRSVYDGGVMKYVCRLRMRDAAKMIEEGRSADEICEALSFHDKNYFSFVFRRELGMTPSEYRRNHTPKEIEL